MPDGDLSALYGNLVPQQNAGGALGQTLGNLGQMLQMKSAAMELQARSAMGPLAQASVNPQTGVMDYNKFATLVASDPRTAWKAPEILNQLVARQLTQAQTLKTTMEGALEQQKLIGNAVAGLAALGPNVTKDDVAKKVAELQGTDGGRELIPPGASTVKFLQSLPADGAPLAAWVKQSVLRSMAAQNNFEQILPKFQTADTGGGVTFFGTQAGQPVIGGTVAKTPTTGEYYSPQTVRNAEGAQSVVPRGEALGMPQPGGAGPVAAPGAAPPPNGTGGEGAPVPGEPSPRNLTELSPAQKALQESRFDDKKYLEKLDQEASAANNVTAYAQQAGGLLKQIQTGGGGNIRMELGTMLQAMQRAGVPIDQKMIDSVANGSLAGSQQYNKVMMQLATNLMTETLRGGGRFTNLEYSNFQKANPNLDTDPQAAQKMLGFIQKLSDLKVQEQQMYNEYKAAALSGKLKNGSYLDFQSRWNKYLNSVLKADGVKGEL